MIEPDILSDLGDRPTSLTRKGKEMASVVLQGKDSSPNHQTNHEKKLRQPPKKAKQKWVVKAINSLRLKPFYWDIEEMTISSDGRKGPKSYGVVELKDVKPRR